MTKFAILWLLGINAIAYVLFWRDKRLAQTNGWRISESTLLGASALGGSPAAYFAMKRFHHKTAKTSFRLHFWAIVAVQVIVAATCVAYRLGLIT